MCTLYLSHLGAAASPYFNFQGITNNNASSQHLCKVPLLASFTTSSPCGPDKSQEPQNVSCEHLKQDSTSRMNACLLKSFKMPL